MTTDAMEALRGMTAEAALANSVSTFKTPLKSFDGRPARLAVLSDGYGGKEQLHIYWTDLSNIQADTPVEGDFDWALNMPAKVMKNSPLGVFLISGAALRPDLDNVPAIVESGLKFHVERVVIPGQGTDRQGKPMNDSSGYELKAIVGTGSNGAKAPAAEADPAVLANVIAYASGLTAEQFNMGVLKTVAGAAQDTAIRSAIIGGKFLGEQVAAGRLALDAASGTYAIV